MTDFRPYAALAMALLLAVLTCVVWQLEGRVRRLEAELRELDGRPTIPEYEAIGGTGNIHRRKLGWRVRVVIWWAGVRERLARWLMS